jgi:putative two-component system response regulator
MSSDFMVRSGLTSLDAAKIAKRTTIAYLLVSLASTAALRIVSNGFSGFFKKQGLVTLSVSIVLLCATAALIYWLVRKAVNRVISSFDEVIGVQRGILQQLAMAAKFRDGATSTHTMRVGLYAEVIATEMGIDSAYAKLLREAAELHDIGKLGVPDSVLLKNGKLDRDEREQMQRHVLIGAELLSTANSPTMNLAKTIVVAHHERWDGRGYPHGLACEQIPLEARIVSVADVFDALTSKRSYKNAWSINDAVAEIRKHSGTQFDPTVVDAFLRALPKMRYLVTFADREPPDAQKSA